VRERKGEGGGEGGRERERERESVCVRVCVSVRVCVYQETMFIEESIVYGVWGLGSPWQGCRGADLGVECRAHR